MSAKTDLEIAIELKRRSELPCTCDRDDYHYICMSCDAKEQIEQTQFVAECTIIEPNGTVITYWKHDYMFIGPKRETTVTTKEIPAQSTTKFDFLDNLWQDIIDAVCEAFDYPEASSVRAQDSVSNIVQTSSINDWTRNPYKILGIRLPEHVMYYYNITSMFGGIRA